MSAIRLMTPIVLAFCWSVSSVSAQENLVAKQEFKKTDKKILGWTPLANIGLNAAYSSSSNVIGQTDGSSQTYGLNTKGAYNFADVNSEWLNTVSYFGTTTKTPSQARFIKSSDELKLESLYLHGLPSNPNIGPYVKASAKAPIFVGQDVRANPVTYNILMRNQTSRQIQASTLRLTDGLQPLTTRESTGAFWKAVDNSDIRLDFRLGIGAEQISATGQYAVTGTGAGGVVTVNELKSISQLGVEAAATANGKIDQKTGWGAGVEVLTPFVNNKDATDHRSALNLTSVDGYAKFTSNITSWASLSYDYKLTIQPQLIERAQQTHMFVLNLNYNLF